MNNNENYFWHLFEIDLTLYNLTKLRCPNVRELKGSVVVATLWLCAVNFPPKFNLIRIHLHRKGLHTKNAYLYMYSHWNPTEGLLCTFGLPKCTDHRFDDHLRIPFESNRILTSFDRLTSTSLTGILEPKTYLTTCGMK